MLTHSFFRAGLVLAAGLAFSSFASAQATRTWVSGVGDDVNPCSRTAPCKTFAGAISKTAAGGEISVLDPGGFGAVTITKSMTIDGNGVVASALASGTNGVVVNGAGVNVILRNIQLSGAPGSGFDGIRYLQGASLTLDNVKITQFSATGGDGIEFAPSAGENRLTIRDSSIMNNGTTNGNGLLVRPTGTATAEVSITGSTFSGNRVGMRTEGATTATVYDSSFANSAIDGVQVTGVSQVNMDNVVASNNAVAGVKTDGPITNGPMALMSNCSVFGNQTGLSNVGGQFVSFGNNRVAGNDVNGAYNTNLPQK